MSVFANNESVIAMETRGMPAWQSSKHLMPDKENIMSTPSKLGAGDGDKTPASVNIPGRLVFG